MSPDALASLTRILAAGEADGIPGMLARYAAMKLVRNALRGKAAEFDVALPTPPEALDMLMRYEKRRDGGEIAVTINIDALMALAIAYVLAGVEAEARRDSLLTLLPGVMDGDPEAVEIARRVVKRRVKNGG